MMPFSRTRALTGLAGVLALAFAPAKLARADGSATLPPLPATVAASAEPEPVSAPAASPPAADVSLRSAGQL
jgi:hypothetical protein